jgi:hypothetical protein
MMPTALKLCFQVLFNAVALGEKLDIKKKLLAHEKILGSSLKNHQE